MLWQSFIRSWVIDWLPNRVRKMTDVLIRSEVINTNTPWFLTFSCPRWCGPCRRFAKEQKVLALSLYGDSVKFGHIDCDDFRDYCNSLGVNEYPTIRLYNSIRGTMSFNNQQEQASFVEQIRKSLP